MTDNTPPNPVQKPSPRDLIMAVHRYDVNAVDRLLQSGADPDGTDREGYTPLMYASWDGSVAIAYMLIQAGADVNKKSRYGDTALLMLTADLYYGEPALVKMLLDKGANTNEVDRKGLTPLMYAAMNGHVDTVRQLLKHGALPETKNKDGKTALDLAVEKDHPEIAEIVQKEIDVRAKAAAAVAAAAEAARAQAEAARQRDLLRDKTKKVKIKPGPRS